jgi:hypothetical protein
VFALSDEITEEVCMTGLDRFQNLINKLRDNNISFDWPRNWWYGYGSAYINITVSTGDILIIRISDHQPVSGRGGYYYHPSDGDSYHDEADLSIHPHSGITLKNIITKIFEKENLLIFAEDAT